MSKRQRRHSQNGLLMRKVLELLREYDLDEVKLLCTRYLSQNRASSRRSSRKSTRRSSRRSSRSSRRKQ